MIPLTLCRRDEPHLFDALCWMFADRGAFVGDGYGELCVDGHHFTFGFPVPTELKISTHGGSYWAIEHEALAAYNEVVDPDRAAAAQQISDDDPSYGGRPYWDVL
jgi:hypothetical protein